MFYVELSDLFSGRVKTLFPEELVNVPGRVQILENYLGI